MRNIRNFKSLLLFILLLATHVLAGAAYAQSVGGIALDKTGEPVIGATVLVKGTTNGTVTDLNGTFTLSNVNNGDVIEVSYIGYRAQTLKYTG